MDSLPKSVEEYDKDFDRYIDLAKTVFTVIGNQCTLVKGINVDYVSYQTIEAVNAIMKGFHNE